MPVKVLTASNPRDEKEKIKDIVLIQKYAWKTEKAKAFFLLFLQYTESTVLAARFSGVYDLTDRAVNLNAALKMITDSSLEAGSCSCMQKMVKIKRVQRGQRCDTECVEGSEV